MLVYALTRFVDAMTDMPQANLAPRPRQSQALQRLEAVARGELLALQAAMPATAPPDPLLATLAWDLGLSGSDLLG
jgi:hypothetical protein